MKTKKLILPIMLSMLVPTLASAEEPKQDEKKGEAILRFLTNAHTGFGSVNDDRGFDLGKGLYRLPV